MCLGYWADKLKLTKEDNMEKLYVKLHALGTYRSSSGQVNHISSLKAVPCIIKTKTKTQDCSCRWTNRLTQNNMPTIR